MKIEKGSGEVGVIGEKKRKGPGSKFRNAGARTHLKPKWT